MSLALSLLLQVPSALAQPTPWWDGAWADWAKLTFDNAAQAEDLDGFPVLVVLDDAVQFDHAATAPDGADLRFVDADGVTELPYEIERWNDGGVSVLWVQVPRVDASSATDHVWMYFGNPAAPAGAAPIGVWGPEWVGVYHLGGGLADSTAADRDGFASGTSSVAGQVGLGRDSDGSGDWVALPDAAAFDLSAGLTVSLWVHVDGFIQLDWDALVTKGDDTWRLHRCGAGTAAAFSTNGLSSVDLCGTVPLDDGGWHYVAASWDPGTGDKWLAVDGVVDAQAAGVTGGLAQSADAVWIGNNLDHSWRTLDGQVDEVRIASTPRTLAWAAADHRSVTDTFVTWCTPWLGDADRDGVCDVDDACPASDDLADADADLTPDGCDPCPLDPDDDCADVDTAADTGTEPATGTDPGTTPPTEDPADPPADDTGAPMRRTEVVQGEGAAAGCGCRAVDGAAARWLGWLIPPARRGGLRPLGAPS